MTDPGPAESVPPVRWLDDRHLEVAGTRLTAAAYQESADTDQLVIIKSPATVRRLVDLLGTERPRRIVELGVKEGGSTALIALVARPEVLVAVDLAEEPPPRLVEVLAASDTGDRVQTHFGVDQSDRSSLVALVDHATDGHPLDLVIDDASHILGPTEASFDALFPRLRPGGIFVIEDWSTDVHTAAQLARSIPSDVPDFAEQLSAVRSLFALLNSPTAELPPSVVENLTAAAARLGPAEVDPEGSGGPERLLGRIAQVAGVADLSGLPEPSRPLVDISVLLMMAAACDDGAIAEVRIDRDWIVVRRGAEPLDPDGFRLRNLAIDHFGYLAGS